MIQAHLDLQPQLDSQNISNTSHPTPLRTTSPILILIPILPANHIEQMETTNTTSESPDTPLKQRHFNTYTI